MFGEMYLYSLILFAAVALSIAIYVYVKKRAYEKNELATENEERNSLANIIYKVITFKTELSGSIALDVKNRYLKLRKITNFSPIMQIEFEKEIISDYGHDKEFLKYLQFESSTWRQYHVITTNALGDYIKIFKNRKIEIPQMRGLIIPMSLNLCEVQSVSGKKMYIDGSFPTVERELLSKGYNYVRTDEDGGIIYSKSI